MISEPETEILLKLDPLRSTNVSVEDNLAFNVGIKVIPPARNFASEDFFISETASFTLDGFEYCNSYITSPLSSYFLLGLLHSKPFQKWLA